MASSIYPLSYIFTGPLMSARQRIVDFGFVKMDARKKSPLFHQLYESVRSAILEGQLPRGSRVPSSRDLVDQLGVSRTTVVSALNRLIAEGYLLTIHGSGTYVASEIPVDSPFVSPAPVARKSVSQPPIHPAKSYLSKTGNQLAAVHQLPGYLGALKPFRPGVPALDEFPIRIWSKLVRAVWHEMRGQDLSYGEPAGHFPLRKAVAEYLRSHRGVRCETEQVIIVNGTQQAFDMIARLCLDAGDKLLFENPGYLKARNTFAAQGARIIPVPVDAEGAHFGPILRRHPQACMAYVTPSHQYPLGVTLPIERRLELIHWAGKTGGLIVEDDYDSEYRYSQKPIPALQGLDSSQRTIYVGSFSKVVFPGLSLGYIIAPQAMVSAFENALALSSRPASLVDQYVLTEFIEAGHFGRHLRRMRRTHAERRHTLVSELEKRMPGFFTIRGSQAGLHLAAKINSSRSDIKLAKQLEQIGIISRSLSDYYLPRTRPAQQINGLVLGFACATPRQIVAATKRMATAPGLIA